MTPQSVEGILVRFNDNEADLLIVLEPDDDRGLGGLADQVEEIVFRGVAVEEGRYPDLVRNLGEMVWLNVQPVQEGLNVEIEGDWMETTNFRCSSLSSTKRDYDVEDLRQKVLVLSRALQSFQQSSGEASRRGFLFRERLAHFIADRRGRWEARRDFFSGTNAEKAKHYAERLEVLSEVQDLLAEECAQAKLPPDAGSTTPPSGSEGADGRAT